MRDLLSGALPAPEDEPQQRDVIDAAMDWGTRRRRRDLALSGAAALAVVAIATGAAVMSGGSGTSVEPAGGARPSSSRSAPEMPAGSWWTPFCQTSGAAKGNLTDYCSLYTEQQNFNVDFVQGSVKYLQAALPAGFTLKASGSGVLVLTGPNGKTNYLFPSVEPASTLDGHPLSCGTPARAGCVQTSTAGGTVVVNTFPSGDPSAGYVGDGQKDPRVDILLGTSVEGGINGVAAPTSPVPLLDRAQQSALLTDPGFLAYAKAQLQHLEDVTLLLRNMTPPPMPTGSSFPSTPRWSWPPTWNPSSGATGTGSSGPTSSFPSGGPTTSGSESWPSTPPSGTTLSP